MCVLRTYSIYVHRGTHMPAPTSKYKLLYLLRTWILRIHVHTWCVLRAATSGDLPFLHSLPRLWMIPARKREAVDCDTYELPIVLWTNNTRKVPERDMSFRAGTPTRQFRGIASVRARVGNACCRGSAMPSCETRSTTPAYTEKGIAYLHTSYTTQVARNGPSER